MNRAGGLALCTALLLPATSLLLGSGARAGAPAATEVSYWGTMFSAPQSVTQLNPTALSFPQPVIQVGTSNSTSYALLKNGAVMAWGIGNDGQLGDGGTSNSSTPLQEPALDPKRPDERVVDLLAELKMKAGQLDEAEKLYELARHAASPARYMVERGDWKGAAELQARPSKVPHAMAITYFARALGAARSGNPGAAKEDIVK
ncbi:MAG: hypothetical protein ACLQGJ_10430, partial [Candidatus Dormibacteria bacterium]